MDENEPPVQMLVATAVALTAPLEGQGPGESQMLAGSILQPQQPTSMLFDANSQAFPVHDRRPLVQKGTMMASCAPSVERALVVACLVENHGSHKHRTATRQLRKTKKQQKLLWQLRRRMILSLEIS